MEGNAKDFDGPYPIFASHHGGAEGQQGIGETPAE